MDPTSLSYSLVLTVISAIFYC